MNDSTQTAGVSDEPIHPQKLLDAIPNFGDYRVRTDALVEAQRVLIQAGVTPSVYPKEGDETRGIRAAYDDAVRRLRDNFKLKEGTTIADSHLILHDRDFQGLAIEVSTALHVNHPQNILDEYGTLPRLLDMFSTLNARQRAEVLCCVAAVRAGMAYEEFHAENGDTSSLANESVPTPEKIESLLSHDPLVESATFTVIRGLFKGNIHGTAIMRLIEACFKCDSADGDEGEISVENTKNEDDQKVFKVTFTASFGTEVCLDMLAPTIIINSVARRFEQILIGYCYYALNERDALQDKAIERYEAITPDPSTITIHNVFDTCFELLEAWVVREVESKKARRTLQEVERMMKSFGIDPSKISEVKLADDDDDDDDEEDDDGQEAQRAH